MAARLSYHTLSSIGPPTGVVSTIHAHFHERVKSLIRPLSPNQQRRIRKTVRSIKLRGKTCDARAATAPSICGAASVSRYVQSPPPIMKVTVDCSLMLAFLLQLVRRDYRCVELTLIFYVSRSADRFGKTFLHRGAALTVKAFQVNGALAAADFNRDDFQRHCYTPCLRYFTISLPLTTVRECSLRPCRFASFVVTLSL